MSHVEFPCPSCASTIRLPAEAAGRRGRCRSCGSVFTVPDVGNPVDVATEPAPETEAADGALSALAGALASAQSPSPAAAHSGPPPLPQQPRAGNKSFTGRQRTAFIAAGVTACILALAAVAHFSAQHSRETPNSAEVRQTSGGTTAAERSGLTAEQIVARKQEIEQEFSAFSRTDRTIEIMQYRKAMESLCDELTVACLNEPDAARLLRDVKVLQGMVLQSAVLGQPVEQMDDTRFVRTETQSVLHRMNAEARRRSKEIGEEQRHRDGLQEEYDALSQRLQAIQRSRPAYLAQQWKALADDLAAKLDEADSYFREYGKGNGNVALSESLRSDLSQRRAALQDFAASAAAVPTLVTNANTAIQSIDEKISQLTSPTINEAPRSVLPHNLAQQRKALPNELAQRWKALAAVDVTSKMNEADSCLKADWSVAPEASPSSSDALLERLRTGLTSQFELSKSLESELRKHRDALVDFASSASEVPSLAAEANSALTSTPINQTIAKLDVVLSGEAPYLIVGYHRRFLDSLPPTLDDIDALIAVGTAVQKAKMTDPGEWSPQVANLYGQWQTDGWNRVGAPLIRVFHHHWGNPTDAAATAEFNAVCARLQPGEAEKMRSFLATFVLDQAHLETDDQSVAALRQTLTTHSAEIESRAVRSAAAAPTSAPVLPSTRERPVSTEQPTAPAIAARQPNLPDVPETAPNAPSRQPMKKAIKVYTSVGELLADLPDDLRPAPGKGWDQFTSPKVMDWMERNAVGRELEINEHVAASVRFEDQKWMVTLDTPEVHFLFRGSDNCVGGGRMTLTVDEARAKKFTKMARGSMVRIRSTISGIQFVANGRGYYISIGRKNMRIVDPN